MNRHFTLTDDAIEAVFARRAARANVGNLRDLVLEASTVRQSRGLLPTLGAALGLGATVDRNGRRALVLVLTIAALIALVVLGAIVASRLSDPRRGERLAFIRDGDVYVANSDGASAVRLLHVDGTGFSDPAWSPDGTRLALDSTGGAVLVDVASGAIQRIDGTNPAWAPDGGRIAVLGDATDGSQELRVLDPRTGSVSAVAPLSAVGPLVWSPNGRWIALTGISPRALLRMDTATGELVRLDASDARLDSPRDPGWSPDSSRIAFKRYGNGCNGAGGCSNEVLVANADGSGASVLLTGSGSLDSPLWSPSGGWIAVRSVTGAVGRSGSSNGLIIARPDGTGAKTITGADVDGYTWNATGDGLLYSVRAGPELASQMWETSLAGETRSIPIAIDATRFGRTNAFVWSASVTDRLAAPLPSAAPATPVPVLAIGTPLPATPVDIRDSWPMLASRSQDGCDAIRVDTKRGIATTVASVCNATTPLVSGSAWSSDGSTYAAAVIAESGASGTLTFVHADGTVTTNVAGLFGLSSVAWSPDGRWLTTSGDQAQPGSPNYLMRMDTKLLRTLPGPPTWSQGSGRMVVSAADGSLLIGAPDGTDLQSIGSFPAPSAWAPDGSRFAFIRNGDVWIASAEGTDTRNLTAFPFGGALTAAWSPAGDWIAVSAGRSLWLMRPDGSNRRFIDLETANQLYFLVWSPDSHRLAAVTDKTAGGQSVFLITTDGSSAVTLDASSYEAAWSPESHFLAIGRATGDGYDVTNADGSGRTPLPGVPGGTGFAWIPDPGPALRGEPMTGLPEP